MITRALIQECISPFMYKVRIPIFDRIEEATHHTSNENLLTAVASINKGCNNQFQVGDIVFIAFENNDLESPVIIGHLYREALLDDKLGPVINAKNLNITGNTTLSTSTQIGDINYQKLFYLKQVNQDIQTSLNSITSDIDILQNNMANFNHVYSLDSDYNVTFPNKLNAKSPLDGITLPQNFEDDTTVVTIGYLKAKGLI